MTIPRVPIFPAANRNDEGHLSLYWWGWHRHRLFQEQTTMKRPTCRSIDGNKDADMIGKQLYSVSCYRVYYYITQFSSEVTPPVMYKSRQCTYRYSHANQVWGNGQWFQRANDDTTGTNFSNERTCLSIDEDDTDTDTDFSRSKQQWRDQLVALLMVTKMRTSSTVNTSTAYQMQRYEKEFIIRIIL